MKKYYKNKIEDFQVTEAMLSQLDNEDSEYMTYILTKRGISTFDAIQYISEKLDIDHYDIGYGGLKDEDGITEQQISIKKRPLEKEYYFHVESELDEKAYISLVFKGYRSRSIGIGKLLGNMFKIVLRNLDEEEAQIITSEKKRLFYFINYYDTQRFGLPKKKKVTHLIGKNLLEENYEKAYEYLKVSNNIYDLRYEEKEAFANIDTKKISFFKNSFSSFNWNTEIRRLLSLDFDDINNTELDGIKFDFLNNQSDVIEFGKKYKFLPFTKYKFEGDIEESYRPTVIQTMVISSKDYYYDDVFKDKYKCKIEFFLPSGVYATMLIRQLLLTILK